MEGRERGKGWAGTSGTWFGEGAGGFCGFVAGLGKEQGVCVGLNLVWGKGGAQGGW